MDNGVIAITLAGISAVSAIVILVVKKREHRYWRQVKKDREKRASKPTGKGQK